MSTTTRIELAAETAERFMTKEGYGHGPCLAVKLQGESADDKWEVEFAYEGQVDRCATSDPPSIILLVDLKSEQVTTLELM
jgi:hypothetical protein